MVFDSAGIFRISSVVDPDTDPSDFCPKSIPIAIDITDDKKTYMDVDGHDFDVRHFSPEDLVVGLVYP
jgi:hypothetical protein